ncbi:MAG TPA: periplasmic heavy metal sensor [Pyrinomonadaceae bacterium]|nr:periplasmic heavy metal sensor [Pyrinomonadaceae bacterium]
MNSPIKSRWQLRAAAVLIFVLGVAAGALAPLAYRGWAHRGGGPPRSRGDRFERMLQHLELNDGQKAQVKQILGETREQYRALRRETEPREQEIRRRTDERLRQVLTPEQWEKFQKEMSERRGRGRGGRRGGDGPPRGQPPDERP